MACRTRRRVKERLNNSNYIETSEAPEASRRGSVSNFKLTLTKTLKYSNPAFSSYTALGQGAWVGPFYRCMAICRTKTRLMKKQGVMVTIATKCMEGIGSVVIIITLSSIASRIGLIQIRLYANATVLVDR